MRMFHGYMRGIGIGGWLTNYKRMAQIPKDKQMDITIGDMEHFASYITEWDVANIASFGVDHIRLAFDQLALEKFEEPYVYREEVWEHIDRFLDWAKKYNLNVILNLHHAFGCYCDCGMDKPLLDTPEYRERFVKLWVRFEERYHDHGDEILFELMNEIRDSKSDKWITLYKETVAAIRALNPTRLITAAGAANPYTCTVDFGSIVFAEKPADPAGDDAIEVEGDTGADVGTTAPTTADAGIVVAAVVMAAAATVVLSKKR